MEPQVGLEPFAPWDAPAPNSIGSSGVLKMEPQVGLEPFAPWDAPVPNSIDSSGVLKMEPQVGLEPTTCRLQGGCSTN